VPSDGSHLGSVSANSIGLDSIGDPLADGLSDQDQQERGGEGLNLAAEMEILGPVIGHGILAGTYLTEYRDSLK